MGTTKFTGNVRATGNLQADGSLIVNGNTISSTEIGYVDGVTAGTAAASKAVVLDASKGISTITSASITNVSTGATPVPMVDVAGTTITPAAGAANVCNVTIQFKDGGGTSIARVVPYTVYLSDSAAGAGVTATTASGTVTHTTGTDIVALTAKKVIKAISNSSGQAVLAITDTVKTGFYVAVSTEGFGLKVGAQLVTGNYG